MLVPRTRPEQRARSGESTGVSTGVGVYYTATRYSRRRVPRPEGRGGREACGFAPDTPLDAKSRGGEETPKAAVENQAAGGRLCVLGLGGLRVSVRWGSGRAKLRT